MATTVDERVVAAKFDSSDFEKGVDKTIKKLDELKKSLNIQQATKDVQELAKKTEASADSMSKSLDKLSERFTTFVGMIKQKILSGLADEVAGVFLKMEQSVKSFIKGISSDQVAAGMSKYEQMLTSVRIMMSAGETQNSAYEAIGRLRDYSDQTSYSLSQMTDALSKLRAAGVDIDTATKSVEGIANACANAGINAQDAQRAFFNLSQAYSSGVLKYTDYRSLELLNMTTADFKKQILEAAVAAGTLEEVSDGVYKTINKNNKKVTAGKKVTEKNLQDMLRYNFVTSDVMNELFGGKFFFDEQKFKEYKTKYKDLDAAIEAAKKDYGETAVNAYLAAREARSFTDVINTLKDVVSTGWSTTFEHLFGKLDEAKDFFTKLAEGELADVIYKIGEYRNALLGYWDDLDAEGNGSGGKVLRDSILNITDALGTLLKTFQQILPGFDELNNSEEQGQPILQKLGDNLYLTTLRFRDFTKKIKEAANNFNAFMNEKVFDDGTVSRIDMIRQVFANLSSVFGIIGKVVVVALNAISKAFYTLSPIFDGFMKLMQKITEPLVNLKNNTDVFKDIQYTVDNILTVLDPIAKVLGTIIGFLGEVGAFFVNMAIDTAISNITFFSDALGLVIELITGNSAQMKDGEGVIASIRKDFEGIKEACSTGLSAVKEFFGALIGDIRKLLGLSDEAEKDAEDQNGGIFAGLMNFFNTNQFVQDAKKWVEQAIVDVGDFIKSIPEKVLKFGANIYDTLYGLFFTEQTQYNGSTLETKKILTPLGEWFDNVIKDIRNWFILLPDRIINGVKNAFNWIDEVFNYWFGAQDSDAKFHEKDESGQWKETDSVLVSRFEEFITNIKNSVIAWFSDLPNKIRNAFQSVGNFITNLYNALDEFLFGKKTATVKTQYLNKSGATIKASTVTKRYKDGFSKWLDGVIQEVKKFIAKIPDYIRAGIRGAGDIISTVIGALFGKPEETEISNKDVEEKLEKPFLGINISNILNIIKSIGTEILNQIARMFTGSEDVDANMDWFANKVAEGIEWIRTKASVALHWVLDFLKELPTKIANFFKGEHEDNADNGPIGSAITNFGKTIGKFITEDLPNTILGFIDNAVDLFGDIWDKLYNALVGESEEKSKEVAQDATEAVETDAIAGYEPQPTAWQKFVQRLGETLSHIWEELPVWIANGIEIAIAEIDKLLSNIGTWMKGIGVQEEVEKTAEEMAVETTEGMAKGSVEGEEKEESKLVTAIKKIGERIKDLFVETIPSFIQDAWAAIAGLGSKVFMGFASIFTGEVPDNEISAAVNSFGKSVYKFITEDVPSAIIDAFDFIVGLFQGEKEQATEKIEKEASEDLPKELLDATERGASAELSDATKQTGLKDSIMAIFDKIFGENGILSGDLGQKITDFFTKTVPNLIGKAIGSLINAIPEIYRNFSEGMLSTASAEAEKTEKDATTEADSAAAVTARIGNAFSGILETFAKGLENGTVADAAVAIIRLIAIVELLKVVKDIISTINVTKNLAEKSEAANSFTATMKRIATALMASFALVAYLTMIPDEKRKDAMEVIKDLTHLFELLVTMTTVGSAIKDVTGTVKGVSNDIADIRKIQAGSFQQMEGLLGDNKKELSKWDKLGNMGVASLSTIGKTAAVTASAEMIQYGLEDILGSVIGVFEALASGLETVSDYIAKAVGNLLSIKHDIDSAIEVAGKAIEFVSKLSELGDYYDEIKTIESFMPSLSGALALFTHSVSGRWIHAKEITESINDIIDMSDRMEAFAEFTKKDTFEQFKYGLASIGAALSLYTLEGVNANNSETGIAAAVRILSDVLGNDELAGLAQQLDTNNFPNSPSEMYQATEKIVILAGAIASISKASAGIENDAGDNLKKLFDAVSKIEVSGDSSAVNTISGQFGTLGNALGTFADSTAGLTEDKLKSVKMAIDIMVDLTENLKGTGQGFIEKVFEGDQGIDKFGEKISIFGSKLNQFFKAIDGEDVSYNPDNVSTALITLRTIAVAYRDLNEKELLFKTSWTDVSNGLVDFGGSLKAFIEKFNTLTFTDADNTKMRRMLDLVYTLAEVSVLGNGQNANTELGEMANQLNPNNKNGIGYAMIQFFNAVNDPSMEIDDKAIEIFQAFGKTLTALAEISAAGITTRSGGVAYMRTVLDNVVDSFSNFNTHYEEMKTFFQNAREFDQEGLKIATDLFKSLYYFSYALANLAHENIDRGLNNLKWFDWGNLGQILREGLYSTFEDSNGDDFKPLGTIIAQKLFVGIQEAFKEDENLRPEITPVLNMDVAEAQLRDFFGLGESDTVDLSGLARSASGANSTNDESAARYAELCIKIDAVASAIGDLKDSQVSIGDVTNAFANMKIVTDTGVLAGELTDQIDEGIGRKIWMIENNITPHFVK